MTAERVYRVTDARTGAQLLAAGPRAWDFWFDRNRRSGVIRAWAVTSDTKTEKQITVQLRGRPA